MIMSEHELLKEICDKIWYLVLYAYDDWYYETIWRINYRYVDVREIIFTQEFMDKLSIYCLETLDMWRAYDRFCISLIQWHLNNPVEYLADLLEIN